MKKKDATILIVDDSWENRRMIELILSPLYPSLFFASSGEEAFKVLIKNEIDLVISDYEMPGTDGQWLLENINTHALHTKVMIVSGSTHINEEDVRIWGGKMFLRKPYSPKDFLQMVAELVNGSP